MYNNLFNGYYIKIFKYINFYHNFLFYFSIYSSVNYINVINFFIKNIKFFFKLNIKINNTLNLFNLCNTVVNKGIYYRYFFILFLRYGLKHNFNQVITSKVFFKKKINYFKYNKNSNKYRFLSKAIFNKFFLSELTIKKLYFNMFKFIFNKIKVPYLF